MYSKLPEQEVGKVHRPKSVYQNQTEVTAGHVQRPGIGGISNVRSPISIRIESSNSPRAA